MNLRKEDTKKKILEAFAGNLRSHTMKKKSGKKIIATN